MAPFGRAEVENFADLASLFLFLIASGIALAVAVKAKARTLILEARRIRARLRLAFSAGNIAAWEWDVSSGRMTLLEAARSVSAGIDVIGIHVRVGPILRVLRRV